MAGFEPGPSHVGSDRSANCATTFCLELKSIAEMLDDRLQLKYFFLLPTKWRRQNSNETQQKDETEIIPRASINKNYLKLIVPRLIHFKIIAV